MKKLYSVALHGRQKEWEFTVAATPHDALAWKLDGLEVTEVIYIVPEWMWNMGWPAQLWCTLQDAFRAVCDFLFAMAGEDPAEEVRK